MPASGAARIPTVEERHLDALNRAHDHAQAELTAMPPLLRETAEAWLLRGATLSLASIRPSWFAGDEPPLLPAPRGYLSEDQRDRLEGVRAALTHVRASLKQNCPPGRVPLSPEMPFVLNALAEGRRRPVTPTYPGMLRPVNTRWTVRDHPYNHPPADWCRDLLAAMSAEYEEFDGHPVVGGAWLMFFFLSIHPFVDGNGRTSRLLYLLVTSPGIATEIDLGIAEQWIFHRHRYTKALYDGQRQAPGFDVLRLDARPFVEATLGWSHAGAQLTRSRLLAMQAIWEACGGLDDEARSALLLAAIEGLVTPDRLPVGIGNYATRLGTLVGLVECGYLERVLAPPSRRTPGEPPRPHFALTNHMARQLGWAVSAFLDGHA